MFGFGEEEKPKEENKFQVIYFNTKDTFIIKDLPIKEDGTISYGSKSWDVKSVLPYLEVHDGLFSKGKVMPTYILTNETAFPHRLSFTKSEKDEVNNPLMLHELISFKALKQMMNFRIMKEGEMGGGGSKWLKWGIFAALMVGAYLFLRYYFNVGS